VYTTFITLLEIVAGTVILCGSVPSLKLILGVKVTFAVVSPVLSIFRFAVPELLPKYP
jgi:hypothetical protein